MFATKTMNAHYKFDVVVRCSLPVSEKKKTKSRVWKIQTVSCGNKDNNPLQNKVCDASTYHSKFESKPNSSLARRIIARRQLVLLHCDEQKTSYLKSQGAWAAVTGPCQLKEHIAIAFKAAAAGSACQCTSCINIACGFDLHATNKGSSHGLSPPFFDF